MTTGTAATAGMATVRIVLGAASAVGRTKLQTTGPLFYVLIWMMFPIFNLLMVGMIYRENNALRDYAVIGGAGLALLFGMLFSASELLDQERQRGTLGNLFLAPCSRYAWLGGFQLFAVTESFVTATLTLTTGALVFGLNLHLDVPAVALVLVLYVACMWGISMVVGAIGVAIRAANQLSNLLFAPIALLSGTMYPIALMPDWLRIPARFLPFGYGVQALVDTATKGASIGDVGDELWPLAGFAVLLPVLGMLAFGALERLTRQRGSLELT